MEYKIGEIRNAKELGKEGYRKFIYLECPVCHKKRWADMTHFKKKGGSMDTPCQVCNGRMQGKINSRKSNFSMRGKYVR